MKDSLKVTAKIRYNMQAVPARVEPAPGETEGSIRVRFDDAQRAVTPGQSVVLYDGDMVVGGGTIERAVGRGGAAGEFRRIGELANLSDTLEVDNKQPESPGNWWARGRSQGSGSGRRRWGRDRIGHCGFGERALVVGG